MKRIITLMAGIAATAAAFISCSNDNNEEPQLVYNATVTFKPFADGYYLQQDDSTVLSVGNSSLKDYPFKEKKERRALIRYMDSNRDYTGPKPASDYVKYAKDVTIIAMDTIHTKNPVAYDSKADYGKDPMGLYLGPNVFPTTLIEDGYLNLCFTVPFSSQKHEINVVYGSNPDDPYELMVTHNNFGVMTGPQTQDYLMCFPLKDLNVPEGQYVTVTLKWYSLVTRKIESVKLPYRGRI